MKMKNVSSGVKAYDENQSHVMTWSNPILGSVDISIN
jgi:hypothetical protein